MAQSGKGATLDGKSSRGESAIKYAKSIVNSTTTKSSASKNSGGKKK